MDNTSSIVPSLTASLSSKDPASLASTWAAIAGLLSEELSEQTFKTWFSPVCCLALDEKTITLGVPDNYYGQWLKNHYQDLLSSSIASVLGAPRETLYQVTEQAPVQTEARPTALPPEPEKSLSRDPKDRFLAEMQEVGFNQKYTFDQFVIGPGNRFSHAASMAVCEAPARQYNPLFIYGPVGLGKTHLMQSIAHEIKQRNPKFRVLYISSEKFTNQLITAIQTRSTQQFRNKYRTLDLLLIDDIHFIAGKEATQEEFFHTFNTLYDAHKQIVVSSDRPPKEIPGLEERLVSRFGWGLVTDIQPPDFETRVAILKKKMEKETVVVPDDVAYFIASKIRSNIRELEGALIRVVACATLTGQVLDLKVAQTVLRDSLREEEQKISMEQIQRVVAEYFNVKVSDLRSQRRNRSIANPRQIAMFLIRTLTSHSLPEIGEYFGGRDHTTVLHSFHKVDKAVKEDIKVERLVGELQDLLKSGK